METFTLQRVAQTKDGVFGILKDQLERPRWTTLEDLWLGNSPNISCIPSGIYSCIKHRSAKFGETFWVKGVPGRSEVIFHAGNLAGTPGVIDGNTQGCILLGKKFGSIDDKWGIHSSMAAMEEFLEATTNYQQIKLNIRPFLGG